MAKLGSSSMARLRKGIAARSPFSDSRDSAVKSLQGIQRRRCNLVKGTSNRRIELSDSPNSCRIFVVCKARPSAHLLWLPLGPALAQIFRRSCSSPPFNPITSGFPGWEIEPASMTLLLLRTQISRATSGVSPSWERVHSFLHVSRTPWSDREVEEGRLGELHGRPCLSVSSKTGSPVVLTKSPLHNGVFFCERGALGELKPVRDRHGPDRKQDRHGAPPQMQPRVVTAIIQRLDFHQ